MWTYEVTPERRWSGRSPADWRSASRLAAVKARDMSYWDVDRKVVPSILRFGGASLSINLVSADVGFAAYSQIESLSWHFEHAGFRSSH